MTAKTQKTLKDSGRVECSDGGKSLKLVSFEERKKEASQPLYLARYE